jgi:hypothetical protein
LEAGEDIQIRLATWDEALALAHGGQIQDGKTLVGLLYYEAFKRRS